MLMAHFQRNPNSDVPKWQAAQVWEARVVIPPSAPPTPAFSPPPIHPNAIMKEQKAGLHCKQNMKPLLSILPKSPNNAKYAGKAHRTRGSPKLDFVIPQIANW